jgi:Arc/MetJ-type ribon-helix-helix transcriptional regulator
MTESITVRLTEEEINELRKHGRISDVVRRAIRQYIQSENSQQAIQQLRELQSRYKVSTTTEEDLRLIHEDRRR